MVDIYCNIKVYILCLLTYLLNIDMIVYRYGIEIEKWYISITSDDAVAADDDDDNANNVIRT